MFITAISLYRDTYNFIIQKMNSIIIIAFLSSIISTIINYGIILNIYTISNLYTHYNTNNIFELINIIPLEQKIILIKISILKTISYLISNTSFIGLLIIFISIISNHNRINIVLSIKKMFSIFLHLFSLLFILSVIIQLGFIFFILPGIIGLILLSLSPIILIIERKTIIDSMYSSILLTKEKIYILAPAIIIWILGKLTISMLLITIFYIFPEFISFLLQNTINNCIFSILIVYLYRFYMLTR
ncbi:UPF0259 membrane protein YciC [Buchnera aphidicola (Eriosoma lanigerum)]|uniref:YciC family protein n=1 Tax=Buchnera aphidicola TaxID=9 RepID=UPI003464E5B8